MRGAPLIAIVGALSLAVQASNGGISAQTAATAAAALKERLNFLVTSRPTAVNLADAAFKLSAVLDEAAEHHASAQPVLDAYVLAAEAMVVW